MPPVSCPDVSGIAVRMFRNTHSMMERENMRLAHKFADTVDSAVEFAGNHNISDEDFRIMINNAICDLLGIDEPELI